MSWACALVSYFRPRAQVAFLHVALTDSISLPNPVYHQVAFATIMLLSIARAAFLLRQLPQERRSKLARTLTIGVLVFVSGFGIWNLDNYFCTRLRATREWLGDHGLGVLGHLTEGHGWWHILTTCGAFNIFTACIGKSRVYCCSDHRTLPVHKDKPVRVRL